MTHVLVITNEVIGRQMAGPGVRAWEIARALAEGEGGSPIEVTLAVPPHVPHAALEAELPFRARLVTPDAAGLRAAAAAADVVFTQGFVLLVYPWLAETCQVLALDIYDPFVLEGLAQYAALPSEQRWAQHVSDLDALLAQLRAGDFFVCASEKQRDFWVGMLTALGRVNPATHDQDPSLRKLLAVVPFGIPSEPPARTRAVLKGVWPGIGPDDRVLLWHGGIWNWLDPLTLLRAMPRVVERHPGARLFFMGVRHPNPQLPDSAYATARDARALAADLGLIERSVFFNEWVDYADRVNFLCEADVSVMTYGDHLETRFAHRTRLVDAIYTGLPIVCTRGDTLGDMVEQRGLGYAVPAGDVPAVAAALIRLLDEPDARAARAPRFRELAESLTWRRVVAPLAAFCADPRTAPDKERTRAAAMPRETPAPAASRAEPTPLWELPGRALTLLVRRGPAGLAREVSAYARWRFAARSRDRGLAGRR